MKTKGKLKLQNLTKNSSLRESMSPTLKVRSLPNSTIVPLRQKRVSVKVVTPTADGAI